MAKKYIEAKEFWNRLISRSENDWVGFDTIDEVLSGMPDIDYEIINNAHNEGYDVGYWSGRRDYEPKWIPCSECKRRCEKWENLETSQVNDLEA